MNTSELEVFAAPKSSLGPRMALHSNVSMSSLSTALTLRPLADPAMAPKTSDSITASKSPLPVAAVAMWLPDEL